MDALSLEKFRELAELSLDILTISGEDGRFSWVNSAATRALGWSFEELTSRPYVELLHPDDVEPTRRGLRAVLQGRAVLDSENRYLHMDGTYRWLSWRCGPMSSDGLLVATARDVTEVRQLKEIAGAVGSPRDLAEREAQLRAAEESARCGSWTWKPATNEVEWSASLYRLLGVPTSERASFERFFALIHPADLERVEASSQVAATTGELPPLRYRIRRASDGRVVHVQATGTAIRLRGEVETLAGILLDISEAVERERALRHSEGQLREAQRMANVGHFRWDRSTGETTWSEQVYRIFDASPGEKLGRDVFFERVHPEDRDHLRSSARRAMARGETFEASFRFLVAGREVRHVHLAARPEPREDGRVRAYVGVLHDVTDRRRLEEELRHAQKMEAIGRLAGGVAHDFNNALTAIVGNAEMARLSLEDGKDARRFLDAVLDAGRQATDVTRQLLAFARRQVVQPRVLDPAERIVDVRRVLEPVLGEDILIDVRVEADGGRIRMDPGQLEQLLLNFAVNARDAMPEGGVLTLACSRVRVSANHEARRQGVAEGEFVVITVSDTGVGMDEGVRERIFEPFFTTKDTGRGTGLGLATCHGIVLQNRGHILVRSAPGAGAEFRIFLPHHADAGRTHRNRDDSEPLRDGHESVLLVEDDPSVLQYNADVLRHLGYSVLAVSDGRSALEAVEGGARPDLLLSDVVLPDLRGTELARRIRGTVPACAVLLVSGYTEESIELSGRADENAAFLHKPYSPSELARVVRSLLAPARSADEPSDASPS